MAASSIYKTQCTLNQNISSSSCYHSKLRNQEKKSREEIVSLPPHTKYTWQEIGEGDFRRQASMGTSWLREMEQRSSTTLRSLPSVLQACCTWPPSATSPTSSPALHFCSNAFPPMATADPISITQWTHSEGNQRGGGVFWCNGPLLRILEY